jgi:KUP system potassium uptake protein
MSIATNEGRADSSYRRQGPIISAAVAALGIVYGDLGTSPLYTLQTISAIMGRKFSPQTALGILSLIIWALLITISLKYCTLVMRADNRGEGGILALMSLIGAKWLGSGRIFVIMGLFGAALIYGDGIITPAISVLSALEGLNVATPVFRAHIVPLAVVILIALFAIQRRGTADIGKFSGPLMLLWFVTLAALGVSGIAQYPEVLAALNPKYAISLLTSAGWTSLALLGGIFLAVTGGEALYADMGHIGGTPIRTTWYAVVLPALLLNYAGQTAFLLAHPAVKGNPFFQLAPSWAIYPLVVLATIATIIASQAIITGSFSLTRQAMQLGWLPGLRIRQTSAEEYGQIYVPFVNWMMLLFTVALTIGFGSSVRLAGAYGTAVSTTMLLTTLLLYKVMRDHWRWPVTAALPISGSLLIIDFAFFAANLLKITQGGWMPLTFGATIFIVMISWRAGIDAMRQKLVLMTEPTEHFFRRLMENKIPRIPGTAIFLTRATEAIPPPIVQHVAQIGALHEILIALTVEFEELPRVPSEQRIKVVHVFEGLWYVTAYFGFIEIPDLPTVIREAHNLGCPAEQDKAVYFGLRDKIVPISRGNLVLRWQLALFAFMFRNSVGASVLFRIPSHQYLEVGRQLEV